MKNFIKKTSLVLLFGFGALFLYANLRALTPTELNQPVHLKIYSLGTVPDEAQTQAIANDLRSHAAVTACSVNAAHRTISVTFHPAEVVEAELMQRISQGGTFTVAEKVFPPTPVCPVPPLQAIKAQILNTLRIF